MLEKIVLIMVTFFSVDKELRFLNNSAANNDVRIYLRRNAHSIMGKKKEKETEEEAI